MIEGIEEEVGKEIEEEGPEVDLQGLEVDLDPEERVEEVEAMIEEEDLQDLIAEGTGTGRDHIAQIEEGEEEETPEV